MHNPLPTSYRKPISNVGLCVLVYLATVGVHAMIDGRAAAPHWSFVTVFIIAAAIGIWVRANRDGPGADRIARLIRRRPST